MLGIGNMPSLEAELFPQSSWNLDCLNLMVFIIKSALVGYCFVTNYSDYLWVETMIILLRILWIGQFNLWLVGFILLVLVDLSSESSCIYSLWVGWLVDNWLRFVSAAICLLYSMPLLGWHEQIFMEKSYATFLLAKAAFTEWGSRHHLLIEKTKQNKTGKPS